jgi:hypothetical protein
VTIRILAIDGGSGDGDGIHDAPGRFEAPKQTPGEQLAPMLGIGEEVADRYGRVLTARYDPL